LKQLTAGINIMAAGAIPILYLPRHITRKNTRKLDVQNSEVRATLYHHSKFVCIWRMSVRNPAQFLPRYGPIRQK